MPFLPLSARARRSLALAAAWCVVVGGVLCASVAHAQQQERGFLDRLDHPDRTLHYGGADKAFSASSSVAGKQASVHSFTFKGGGVYGAGDGTFRTRGYNGPDRFRTESYATKPARAAGQEFNQKDKAFGTKAMDVKEDRAANQTAAVRDYAPASKPFLGRGRRQDTIDDLRNQKNLTIDQVREILNKNK